MAISVKLGSFAQPGSTGNQAITGVGFTPDIVFFWMNGLTADGSAAHIGMSNGAAISSASRFYTAVAAQDGHASGFNGTRRWIDSQCIGVVSPSAATVLAEADFVSQDADGFTVNWTTVDASARIVNYLAIDGLTNVFIGNMTTVGTGSASVTGVGFTPDLILFRGIGIGTVSPALGNPAPARVPFGAAISNAQQGVTTVTFSSTDKRSASYQRTDRAGASIATADTPPVAVADFSLTTMDADGFTFDKINEAGSQLWIFVAMKGLSAAIGSFNQATSTGQQSITGLPFTPAAVFVQTGHAVTDSDGSNPGAVSVGVGVSSSSRFSLHTSGNDNGASTSASQNLDRGKLLKTMTAGGATPTLVTAMDLVSFGAGQFVVDNTTVDATSREILYLAIGSIDTPRRFVLVNA